MNLISKSIAISSVAFMIILSTDGLSLKYTFSESFLDQYSTYAQSKGSKPQAVIFWISVVSILTIN